MVHKNPITHSKGKYSSTQKGFASEPVGSSSLYNTTKPMSFFYFSNVKHTYSKYS